jgi:hypothetical protein
MKRIAAALLPLVVPVAATASASLLFCWVGAALLPAAGLAAMAATAGGGLLGMLPLLCGPVVAAVAEGGRVDVGWGLEAAAAAGVSALVEEAEGLDEEAVFAATFCFCCAACCLRNCFSLSCTATCEQQKQQHTTVIVAKLE